MKADERLLVLCEEFAKLDEDEKDKILEISQAMAGSVKKDKACKNTKSSSVSKVKKNESNLM